MSYRQFISRATGTDDRGATKQRPSASTPSTPALAVAVAGCLLATLGWASIAIADAGHWPEYHGPDARGVGEGSPPTAFDLESGDGVLWRTPIPGLAHASPVIWGNTIYTVTATSAEDSPELRVGLYGDITPAKDHEIVHTWWLYALDRASGKVTWKAKLYEGTPAIKRHIKATHANSTPATDGEHVAVFLGSEGLHVYDTEGKRLWKKDFGVLNSTYYMIPAAQWGFASSPIIEDGKVIVIADVLENGFVAAYDVATGAEAWKVDRADVPGWSTPSVIGTGGSRQVLVNGYKHTAGYRLSDGTELWRITSGGGDIPVPRPVVGDDFAYFTNGHGRSPVFAVRPSARGDVTLEDGATANEGVAWYSPKGGTYMQTPILLDGILYACNDNGVLTAFDAESGEEIYKERLTKSGEGFTGSGVAAGGHLYYPSEEGVVHVVKAGRAFEVVGTSDLGEITMTTPAIADGALYIRTRGHMVAIGHDGGEARGKAKAKRKRAP